MEVSSNVVDEVDEQGNTALHHVRHAYLCKLLIEAGADLSITNRAGATALHEAASGARTEICRLLIAAGADVNAQDNKGRTPLIRAQLSGAAAVAALLLEHGAKTQSRPDTSCRHRAPSRWAEEDVEVGPWGETRPQIVEIPGESWLMDISVGAYRCSRCGWTGYYTGLWRSYYERGVPCPGSEGVPQQLPAFHPAI